MPEYLLLVMLIAPGFIAKETSDRLGNSRIDDSKLFDKVMSYFVNSIYSITASLALLISLGIVDSSIAINDSSIAISLQKLLIITITIIITSIVTGAIWQLLLKPLVNWIFNKVTEKLFNVRVDMDNNPLDILTQDGKQHLVKVFKGKTLISAGVFISSYRKHNPQILIENGIYKDWLKKKEYKNYFKLIHTYIDTENNLIIKEYSYPEGFFDGGFDTETLVSSKKTKE